MPFEKGRKKTGGRKKGVTNKVNNSAKAILGELGCDPLKELWEIGCAAKENQEYTIATSCFKELAKYVHPQLKSVDHKHETPEGVVFEVNMIGIEPDGQ